MERLFRTLAVVMMVLALTPMAGAGETQRHSGTIVSIADDARSFVLTEVGPWRVQDGATVITNRRIELTPETEFAIVARFDAPPSGFRGDFVEFKIGPERVYLNDRITVECRHEGRRLVALKITVVEVPASGSGERP
jgi:hypothetical protein